MSEIPEGMVLVTHPMDMDGSRFRNFSYVWDKESMVARWVAYPLNSRLMSGSGGRSDAWGLDPALPEKDQPVLYYGYRESAVWARGHQIPSADRKVRKYNEQTFYGVNMTPQSHDLNAGIWNELEQYVRTRCSAFDTLYVVTGCITEGSVEVAHDNVGKEVTVPTGYFKALLGFSKTGRTGGPAQGYTGVAFYFENRPYRGRDFMDDDNCMSIAELEEKAGLRLFVNLDSAIGAGTASAVKSTVDDWWYSR